MIWVYVVPLNYELMDCDLSETLLCWLYKDYLIPLSGDSLWLIDFEKGYNLTWKS